MPSGCAELTPRPAALQAIPLGILSIDPIVSIIVPSYNQGRFIRATIDSILLQDYRPVTIHVIDGGSTDDTISVLKSYASCAEVNWISERDRGVVHAVNKGFAQVTGEVIAIQSSDDMYLPGALSTVVRELREHTECGLIYGDTAKVDSHGQEIARYPIGPYSLENLFLFRTWIPQPSAFFRREMLDVLGGWDERIPYAPDTDLWIRMAFRTVVRKLDQFLSQRRIHDSQRDTQEAKIVRDYCQMIDQSSDLPHAPPSVQRAALASKHLIRQRYPAGAGDWQIAGHLLRAGLMNARSLNIAAIIHHTLLPFRRKCSQMKQLFR